LYREGARLFRAKKPIVAAIHGPAIGGGLGLALVGDFRVVSPEARFAANFAKLGIHPGFGLTVTLPALIGQQQATLMFYTGRRLTGEEAVKIGLGDVLAPHETVREEAVKLASEIAENAPLAVVSVRATMRQGLADRVAKQTEHELKEQQWLRATEDAQEGIRAVAERRPGKFIGK
jgi:enoyl-CoA hydratase/carnithine racemase